MGQSQKTSCKLAVWHSNKVVQFARARITVKSGQREKGDVHLTGLTRWGKKTPAMPSSTKLVNKGASDGRVKVFCLTHLPF